MAKLTRPRLPQDDAQENFENDGAGFEETAEELPAEGFPGNDRYEEIKRSDIHIAELQRLTMKDLAAVGPQGAGQRLYGAEEAGPHLQDPQRADEDERPDVRRGDAGDPAGRVRLPAQPRLSLSPLPRRYLRQPQPDSPLRPANGSDGCRPDSSAERERTVFRSAACRGDQRPGSEPAGRAGFVR